VEAKELKDDQLTDIGGMQLDLSRSQDPLGVQQWRTRYRKSLRPIDGHVMTIKEEW
jgi:hypothetical protein